MTKLTLYKCDTCGRIETGPMQEVPGGHRCRYCVPEKERAYNLTSKDLEEKLRKMIDKLSDRKANVKCRHHWEEWKCDIFHTRYRKCRLCRTKQVWEQDFYTPFDPENGYWRDVDYE